MVEKIEVLVDAGKATPGPPIGPAVGSHGINVGKVVAEINSKTKEFSGMKVPVTIYIEKDMSFRVEVGIPPTSALIMKELKIEKGSGHAREKKVGNLSLEQVVKIAKMKGDELLGNDLKSKALEVIGTCGSMGITVEGKIPKDIQKDIKEGKYDDILR